MDIDCALPCPPLDFEALFGPTSIDVRNFFDDIEDDGNKILYKPKQHRNGKQMRRVIEALKPNWEFCALPRRPSVLSNHAKKEKAIQSTEFQPADKIEKCPDNKKVVLKKNAPKGNTANILEVVPKSADMSKSKLDEISLEFKLESTKTKLRDDYKDIENKKKKIQIIDFQTASKLKEGREKPDQRKLSCRGRLAKKLRTCGASSWSMQKGRNIKVGW